MSTTPIQKCTYPLFPKNVHPTKVLYTPVCIYITMNKTMSGKPKPAGMEMGKWLDIVLGEVNEGIAREQVTPERRSSVIEVYGFEGMGEEERKVLRGIEI